MRSCLLLLAFVLAICLVKGQDKPVQSIPELLRSLKSVRNDAERAKALLTLADAYILKAGEERSDLDSALVLVNQAIAINKSVEDPVLTGISYILLSKLYREKGEPEKGKPYGLQAVEFATQQKLPVQLGYAHSEMCSYYNWENPEQLKQKTKHAEEAATFFQLSGRVLQEAAMLELLGDCLAIQHRFEESLTILLRAERRRKAAGSDDLQGVYNLLGSVYSILQDPQQGLRYRLLSLRLMEARGDTNTSWTWIYNGVGMSYHSLGDEEDALKYLAKASANAARFKDSASLGQLLTNMVDVSVKLKRYPEALQLLKRSDAIIARTPLRRISYNFCAFNLFQDKGQLDSARAYLAKLREARLMLPMTDYRLNPYFLGSSVYFMKVRRFDSAAVYADSLWLHGKTVNDLHEQNQGHYRRYLADSARGYSASAMKHFLRYVTFKDSVFNDSKLRQVFRLKVEYESEEKDSQIQVLNEQQKEKDRELQEAGFMMKVVIAGVAMLLIMLALLYSRYHIKRKSNRLLTQQKQIIDNKNLEQARLLEEKEWLLKEIHHRVKNNLQIVISLLNTQSTFLENDRAKEAILQSQNRMHAMSLIHQRLYQSDNVATIDMQAYVDELVRYLRESFETPGRLHFITDVAKVQLDASQAVPIGLILNESITNAIKYAFPGDRQGVIRIVLEEEEGGFLLEVRDNGVGLPPGQELLDRSSMGISLMRILARQLGGELMLINQGGLIMRISIAVDEASRHLTQSREFQMAE